MTDYKIAIISDAHYHAIETDWGIETSGGITPRSWSDTRCSTRVFNESHSALLAALDGVAKQGIQHVVLLGDYSDDGQQQSVQAVAEILSSHTVQHGTQFFALPGNHDVSGETGRHHTKEFTMPDGTTQNVSSDRAAKNATYWAGMYCLGQPDGFAPMAKFGFTRQPSYLHWETPFGSSDDFKDRCYSATSNDRKTCLELTDASYLVEPTPGLWLMMIDANVYTPTGQGRELGASSNAGWSAMLHGKPFILEWMADVAARAKQQGKRLLTFSHYPVLDSYSDSERAEVCLFGQTNMAKRTPTKQVGMAVSQTGIGLHFSGHLHVKRVTEMAELINIAVPSLVAYPAAYCVAETHDDYCDITDVRLDDLPCDSKVSAAYLAEVERKGEAPHKAILAQKYGEFLLEHVDALVRHRYLEHEWPLARMQEAKSLGFSQIARLAKREIYPDILSELSAQTVVRDWYALRAAGPLAIKDLGRERCEAYALFAACTSKNTDVASKFWTLFLKRLGDFATQALSKERIIKLPKIK